MSALAAGLNHPLILVGPVEATTGEGTGNFACDSDESSKAIMLDLVNPAAPRDRLAEFEAHRVEFTTIMTKRSLDC